MRPARAHVLPSLLAALVFALSGCGGCGRPTPGNDGGEDAGSDAGVAADAGRDAGRVDAGDPDAGPPPELKINKVLPPRGPSGGGSQVTLQGSAFIYGTNGGTDARRNTTLKFGSNTSLDFQVIDDETISARVPPGNAGLTNVTLTNVNGTFVCTGCFTYYDELYLLGVSPKEGPLAGGNEVTLTGQGFTPDVQVLFGNRSAAKVTLVNDKELKVIAPRGAAVGLVDITAYNKNGVGQQRRVYQYVADLRVSGISPAVGPLAGGTSVTLTGTGLGGATSVLFGTAAATLGAVTSDTSLTVTSPAGSALGAVDLTVVTPRDRWVVKGGFAYVDAAGGMQLYGVFPHLGPAAGGNDVTLLGQGLSSGLTVSIGGRPATVLSANGTSALVRVPARGGGARVNGIDATVGATTRSLANGYTYQLTVGGISPTRGPAAGNTPATVSGTGFPPDAKVFIGALAGTVSGTPSETSASFTTPRGSGGLNDVRVISAGDPENEAVLPAAFTYDEALSVGRVQPDRGAIAGGTLVTVLGAGFGEDTVVFFGANHAKDVKIVDDHTLTCRTPKGEVGSVEVKVVRASQFDVLPGGFSYFDPRSISGGLSGGPLVGTLNVTVLDSTQGFYGAPVPLATVVLGTDPSTPFQGLTDGRGQYTFSDPSLVKAQTVTVFKEGYETSTVTAVASENLTVFVARTGGDGQPGQPPPGPPPSLISGRVTGFKAPRPLTSNESLEARVFVAQRSLYGGPPFGLPSFNGQKWIITTDGGEYLLYTRAGLWATYAVLGVKNKTANSFEPYLWGIKRGITTSADAPATNQDIVLDTHLDMTVPVTIDQPIQIDGVPATNDVYAWLDLGAEGYIPNPNNWSTGTQGFSSVSSTEATLSFKGFPRVDGSNFIFLNMAAGAAGIPQSLFFRRQPGDLSLGITIGPMLPTPSFQSPKGMTPFDGTIRWTLDPGQRPDIHQVQIVKPTLAGNVTLWSVVMPGTETQVVLPPVAVQKLRNEEAETQLTVLLYSSRSPKFNYAQWTYDSLSGISWSSYTLALSDSFKP